MSDLTQAVANLQSAVQGVVDRVGPTVDELKAQVAAGSTPYIGAGADRRDRLT